MRTLSSLVGVLVVSLASTAASAAEESELSRALAEVPPHVRLALELEESPFPEVRLVSLAEAAALEEQGRRLVQTSAPALSEGAPLPRVSSFASEPRVFWLSAGASAVSSLGARVLLIIPTWIGIALAQAAAAAVLGPAATFVLLFGVVGAYTLAESAVAAFVSSLVFDSASEFYTSSFLGSFSGHLAGNALAAGAMWLSLGFGGMLLYGLDALSAFTTGAALGAVSMFSVLGAMPVVVVAFLASVALPATLGAWATATTARPREGFVIDPHWRPRSNDPRTSLERALPEDRSRPLMRTLVTVAIPGT